MIRSSRLTDLAFLYACRTSPEARIASLNEGKFAFLEHVIWYLKIPQLERPYIVTQGGERIGYVRFKFSGEGAAVWSFAKSPMKTGVGRVIAVEGISYAFSRLNIEQLSGVVLASNSKSIHLHEALGFRRIRDADQEATKGQVTMYLERERWISIAN